MKNKLIGVVTVLVAVFLVGGCITPGTVTSVDSSTRVFRYVDEDYNVVCWSNIRDGGIDCIPAADLDPDPGTNIQANP